MSVKKVDIDGQGWTYSSYVIAGDFVFTSICSGSGDTIAEQTESALEMLEQVYSTTLHHHLAPTSTVLAVEPPGILAQTKYQWNM